MNAVAKRDLVGGGFTVTYRPRETAPAEKLSKVKQLEQENARLRAEQAAMQAKVDKLVARLGM